MKPPHPSRRPASNPFPALAREALELLWGTDPVRASALGVERFDPLLPRTDPGSRSDFRRQAEWLLSRLERLPELESLAPTERAERWALGSLLRVPLAFEEEFSPYTRNPVLYPEALLQGIYILLQRPGRIDEARGEAICGRLREGVRLLREAPGNLQPHASRVPPSWAEAAARMVPCGQDFLRSASETLAHRLPKQSAGVERDAGAVLAALDEFAAFLNRDVLPKARGAFAIGRSLFNLLLREEHHLPYRDVDLLEWGQHEVREARRELEKVGRSLAPGGDWRSILEELKEDHPAPDELVPAYRREVERARRFVTERTLASVPDIELAVAESPEFERAMVPFAAYLPPAPFAPHRRGSLWVTPPAKHLADRDRREALRDHCRLRIPITALHETYPGHHLQFSHACQLPSEVLRHYTTAVCVEGWALYCEEMMFEQGFLADPRCRLFQLCDHLWRSCRVVLDVRLHTDGLSIEEAVRMLVDEACLQQRTAVFEVERYTRTPIQPLSYLIGKREIQGLRREVERARGAGFRLGEFHDDFLGAGLLPISFVRDIVLAPRSSPEPDPAPAAA